MEFDFSLDISYELSRWLLAGHVISVISWMAGLLYLPRLFVYHTQCDPGSQQFETLKVMERRLQNAIMNPALIASFGFGVPILMAMPVSVWQEGWLYIKLASVGVLVIFHISLWLWRRDFVYDRNEKTETFFRSINEIPTILMIVIVIFVIVRPF